MKRTALDRERGTVMVTVALIIVILFGITGPILMLSMSESRAVDGLTASHNAFYLAEAGIAAAKYEISEMADPDGDGMGNKTDTTEDGRFSVVAQDIGGGDYQITSNGFANGSTASLEAVVQVVSSTRFPKAAISVVGNTHHEKFKVKKPENIDIDGGTSPAWAITDETFFNKVYNTFKNAIAKKEMSMDDLKGYKGDKAAAADEEDGVVGDDGGELLPVVRTTDYDDSLADLTDLFDGMLKATSDLKAKATVVVDERYTREFSGSYGTPEHPEIVYLKKNIDLNRRDVSISGYGTMIVSRDFSISLDSQLDWHGDIIVVGDVGANAYLRVENKGTLNLDGNLFVLGDAKDSSLFVVRNSKSHATINGSVFVGTEYTDKRFASAGVRVFANADLDINGVLTMIGKRVELNVYKKGDFSVNGTIQIGFPDSKKKWKDGDLITKIEMQGDVRIHKDEKAIGAALSSLYKFGLQNNIPDISNFITREVRTMSWWPAHDQ